MNQADLMKLAIAGAALWGIYKFAPNQAVKAMALGAAGVLVAKRIPYVGAALA